MLVLGTTLIGGGSPASKVLKSLYAYDLSSKNLFCKNDFGFSEANFHATKFFRTLLIKREKT
jgi:hypothetical protein